MIREVYFGDDVYWTVKSGMEKKSAELQGLAIPALRLSGVALSGVSKRLTR